MHQLIFGKKHNITSLFVSFLLQPLRMRVDHLGELLHHVVEGVVVPRHVALADLLI